MKVVFDSYAILAYLEGEPEGGQLQRLLREASEGKVECFLSIINLTEVLYIVQRRKGRKAALETLALIESWPLEIVEATYEICLIASDLKARYRISLADAFAAATAKALNAELMTGDDEFKPVQGEIKIRWLSS